MSINLCIDWGNSRVKAGIFNDDNLVETRSFEASEAANTINELIEAHQPTKAIVCSVANSRDVEEQIRGAVKTFIKLDTNTPLPIMNAYSSPSTLGADRIAMAVAVHTEYPGKNNLAIGIGTCITYNFVQNTRTFRGGAISPGLNMRLQAMHKFTDRLPEVKADGELLLLGYDTETCMRSGAVFGMAAEIDGMIKEFESQYSDFNAVLTGGDAPMFASKLKSKIFADPELVLKGLNIILKYNAPFR